MIEKPPLIQGSGAENRIQIRQSFTNDRKAANHSKRQRKKRFESAGHLLIIHLHAHLGPSCQTTGGFSYIQRLRRENGWRQFIRFEMNGGTDSEIESHPASKRARTLHSIRNERETATRAQEPIAKLSRIPPQNERGPATQSETNEKPPFKRRNQPAAIPPLSHGEPTGTGCGPGNETRPRPQSNQGPPLHSTASISANEAHGAALIRATPSNLIFRAMP